VLERVSERLDVAKGDQAERFADETRENGRRRRGRRAGCAAARQRELDEFLVR